VQELLCRSKHFSPQLHRIEKSRQRTTRRVIVVHDENNASIPAVDGLR
jgi:hypothetical protein